MLRIATKTKLSPEQAIKKAIDYFGPQGLKLELKEQTDTAANFESPLGHVSVSACAQDGKTTVEFISSEFDYQVKEFIKKIR